MAELVLENVFYAYPGTKKDILKGVDAHMEQGTVTAICGQSGAGKSTLLYLLSGLDVAKSGKVQYRENVLEVSYLDEYRRKEVATISQSYLLFPTRTALENVMYPMQLANVEKEEAKKRAEEKLLSVGIKKELHNRLPSKLSGGEQQRVAIARCLAAQSNLIVADEPTGNLDEENARAIMSLLLDLAHKEGKTIILVTHDPHIAGLADVQYRLEYGKLVEYMRENR